MKQNVFMILLGVGVAVSGLSLRAGDPPHLSVHTAIEVEYETELGKSYALQGSTNLSDWADIGTPAPGTGRLVNRIFSTKGGGEVNYTSYRLRVSDGPTNGFAPWTIAGISMELDDEPGGDVTQFLDATNGVDVSDGDNDPFTYRYSRLSENQAQAEIAYASNRSEIVTFEFTGPGVGTWSRDEFRQGKLKDHDAGPFRIVALAPLAGTNAPVINPNVVVAPPMLPPAPPTSLSNLVYYFQASGIPDRYEFLDESNGREVQGVVQEGLPTNALTYTYTVLGSNTAFLRLSFGYYGMGGDRYDCDLTFTDGSSGHFVRRLYRRGVLKDTDDGAFSQNYQLASPDGNSSYPPANTNTSSTFPPVIVPTAPPAPPVSLFGQTYFVFTTPSPDRYQFSGPNYGYATPGALQSGEIETSPGGNLYTYGYNVLGSNSASLIITYGYYNLGGDREEYDLTFVDGTTATFVRRLYRLGVLYTNQNGIFSTNAILPYGTNGGNGNPNNPPPNTNPPPTSLPGLTLVMNTGEQLAFQSSSTGLQTDNSAPTDFTYIYTAGTPNAFTLRVEFKPDKWDEYDLAYTDGAHGTFVRRQYDKGSLKDTDADSFYVVPTSP